MMSSACQGQFIAMKCRKSPLTSCQAFCTCLSTSVTSNIDSGLPSPSVTVGRTCTSNTVLDDPFKKNTHAKETKGARDRERGRETGGGGGEG